MGRINLTPLRVRKRALASLETRKTMARPVWLDVVADIPPSQVLVRPLPLEHPRTVIRRRTETAEGKPMPPGESSLYVYHHKVHRHQSQRSTHKPSKMFSPLRIRYEEDELRKRFFSDHPWELARPRVVVETSGNQHKHADWSTGLIQPGIPLSGESVVQRQLHLLHTVPNITIPQAYDIARKEFYDLRRKEDVTRRIAAEEARNMGAEFGKGIMEWSLEIEDKQHEDWEKWSRQMVAEGVQKTAAFEGGNMLAEDDALAEINEMEAGPESQQRPGIGAAIFSQEAGRATSKGPARVMGR